MTTIDVPKLKNEPLLDFGDSNAKVRERIEEATRMLRENLVVSVPHFVAGVPRYSSACVFTRENPSRIDEEIGSIRFASRETVKDAVRHVSTSSDAREWARMPLKTRARYFKAVAERLRERRFFFIALIMLEVGKQAHLADAEACEAIDLVEQYAAHAEFIEKIGNKMLYSPTGEKNSVSYRPYGPRAPLCAVIEPWNFPLAISAGPIAAALLCGHSVLYKPAEQSSVTGYFLARLFYEAGIPSDLFHFLPGKGEDVGRELVENHGVHGVAFTGSLSVRREIRDAIARFNKEELPKIPPALQWEKRAYALESGGKNAMIVCPDADIDRVIEDVTESAYGFQGERCSALSRLVIVDEKGKRFNEIVGRLAARIRDIPVGSPEDPKNIIGPLIDRDAFLRVRDCMAYAREKGNVFAEGSVPAGANGYFLPPMLVGDLPFESPLVTEEIFGPLLTVCRVRTAEEAILFANRSRYALTFSVHSRNPELVAHMCREIDAGVIYVRGKTTGAVPGRQNFGGGKESGNGTKAGDFTYLLPFLHQVHLSENTMQCGIPME
ncbi:MAG: aldehyde dehydrogenase family protein [Parcubacteria group bacterium]|nr:aldehyde dehydrogenase family protein [Parcubacteria group bacterium]MBI2049149.1 aldehyde dehydrogenase family protein [Parcubacteria group bacterium]